jgi:hypothetical protein
MSDFPEEHEHTVVEPDENVLIAALRNQDDIPILMDIVGDHVSLNMSQEGHLSDTMHHEQSDDQHATTDFLSEADTKPVVVSEVGAASSLHSERIQAAVQKAMEKFLPDIVQEVVKELQADSKKIDTM